jgi:hypothetical protein
LPARPVWLQETHTSSQALSQHTPSTQKPDAQPLALEHAAPFLFLHLPLPSQACPLLQLPGTSVPAAARTQLPWWPATLHDWHAPEQEAFSQHTPSTQKPDAQVDAVAAVQPSPFPSLVTLYSQVSLDATGGMQLEPGEQTSPTEPPNSTITPR